MSRHTTSRLLDELQSLRTRFGRVAAVRRMELLELLGARAMRGASQLERLHELALFARTFPDDRAVLERAGDVLRGFARRAELARHREALRDSGIAGTDIHYRFYWVTARWLARNWPDRLSIDWEELEHGDRLLDLLDLLVPYSESTALDLLALDAWDWIERLRPAELSDAAFLIRRFERLDAGAAVRERLFEQVDVPIRLAPGEGTPSRTLDRMRPARVSFQTRPLRSARPRLRREVERGPVSHRRLGRREARTALDLTRAAMVTRSRDLDAFAGADLDEVREIRCGRGLSFLAFGLEPRNRLLFEASYGFLTIKNGVPIGYALTRSLFGSTEVAYNIFDTFRGAEAAPVFGRLLATCRYLFGGDTFAIDPYQLGHGNEEGLASGAWWFYYKLGFRPVDPEIRRLARSEVAKIRTDPGHRSSRATLERLSADYLFLYLDRRRRDVLGRIDLARISLRITDDLAREFGARREAGLRARSRQAAQLLGAPPEADLRPDERRAWRRWAPLVTLLPGVERLRATDRRALVRLIRAKGGAPETEYLRRFDRHHSLRQALLELANP